MKSADNSADWQRSIFTFNFEIAIIMALLLDIGFDYIVSHIASAATKIPSGPQVTTPILTPERFKTVEQFIRAFAFQPLHQAADRHLWRNGNEKMDVSLGYVPFHNFYGLGTEDFTDQFTSCESNIPNQHGLAILGYPNQVQMNGKNTMCPMTIIAHAETLNKKR
jgi:hypothetical protein